MCSTRGSEDGPRALFDVGEALGSLPHSRCPSPAALPLCPRGRSAKLVCTQVHRFPATEPLEITQPRWSTAAHGRQETRESESQRRTHISYGELVGILLRSWWRSCFVCLGHISRRVFVFEVERQHKPSARPRKKLVDIDMTMRGLVGRAACCGCVVAAATSTSAVALPARNGEVSTHTVLRPWLLLGWQTLTYDIHRLF